MHKLRNYFLVFFVLPCNFLAAQNYQAINGSSYAGSMGTGNNPASIVHVPYAWDITLFAVQAKQSTNAFTIENYSLLSSPGNAKLSPQNGDKKKFVFANQDIRLLNARINLNAKTAIAFGVNIRNYIYATSNKYNWQDTTRTLGEFMQNNTGVLPLVGESKGSTWAELYATYAQTIFDNGSKLINAGLTIKIDRALAGGYASIYDLNYKPLTTSGIQEYVLTTGSLQYGYSSGFDNINKNNTAAQNRKNFLNKTMSSLSADIGLQYIVRSGDDESGYAYTTKIAASLMDLGKNKYRHGSRSNFATAGLSGLTDSILGKKFTNIKSVDAFNDSLASISATFKNLFGDFYIYQPARLVINVDQHIKNNFFINAELTIPVLQLVPKTLRYIKDMNFVALTPRWEIRSLGAYFPILFNTRNQLWFGAAFKAGPLLFGMHNVANLFAKNTAQSGGLYLAFTIRPGKKHDQQMAAATGKQSGKSKRSLECPKF
jgi:hypothetical protein